MDDEHYKEYSSLVEKGDDKEAGKIFKKYAVSQI